MACARADARLRLAANLVFGNADLLHHLSGFVFGGPLAPLRLVSKHFAAARGAWLRTERALTTWSPEEMLAHVNPALWSLPRLALFLNQFNPRPFFSALALLPALRVVDLVVECEYCDGYETHMAAWIPTCVRHLTLSCYSSCVALESPTLTSLSYTGTGNLPTCALPALRELTLCCADVQVGRFVQGCPNIKKLAVDRELAGDLAFVTGWPCLESLTLPYPARATLPVLANLVRVELEEVRLGVDTNVMFAEILERLPNLKHFALLFRNKHHACPGPYVGLIPPNLQTLEFRNVHDSRSLPERLRVSEVAHGTTVVVLDGWAATFGLLPGLYLRALCPCEFNGGTCPRMA